jgi:hypothetical protein
LFLYEFLLLGPKTDPAFGNDPNELDELEDGLVLGGGGGGPVPLGGVLSWADFDLPQLLELLELLEGFLIFFR